MRLPGTATRTSTIPPSCRSGRHAPDTSYTYSLTSPSWTDPTGAYAASLDAFDRAVSLDDPADAGNFTWTYGTGGEVLAAGIPNGNTMTQSLDAAGHLTLRETRTGSTSRARYDYTHNRAGLVLSEDAQVTGDSSNGTIDYRYDPLGRLTTAGATAYAWDAATNRTGAGSSTTAFDAANRPLSGTSPTASYTSDADGQLTARPGQTMTWDHLGRLTSVTTASGTAAYTYDPLDRLRTAQAPDGSRIRFRYTGLTTSAAQWIDDIAGTVTRSIGNGWTGERLLDWTGTGSERRYYGSNAHHDVTWIADSTGAVLASLRYDPWGVPRSPVPQDYTPFRFQGSWHDTSTDLAWVVTRWYAPTLGTFISEDTLLGEPREPDSRHLYAYGAGEPVGSWDPDGHHWRVVRAGDTLWDLALRFYGNGRLSWRIRQGNPGTVTPRNLVGGARLRVGDCIWIPYTTQHAHECKRDRADSRRPLEGLWATFDGVNAWVKRAMVDHAPDGAGGLGYWNRCVLSCDVVRAGLLKRAAELFIGGGQWDIKKDYQPKFGGGVNKPFFHAVRNDPAPESLRSDLWGLVHYSYVLKAHQFPVELILLGNLIAGGVQGGDDDLAVAVGLRLWSDHREGVTQQDVAGAMLRNMAGFRETGGVFPRLQTWFR